MWDQQSSQLKSIILKKLTLQQMIKWKWALQTAKYIPWLIGDAFLQDG